MNTNNRNTKNTQYNRSKAGVSANSYKTESVPQAPSRPRSSKRKIDEYFEYSLLAVVIFLICFGLVMLYSTSSYNAQIEQGDDMYYLKRQLVFSVASLIGVYVISHIDYHWYGKRSKFFFVVAYILMILVQTPLGKTVNGATRWIKLPGGMTLQPAEVMKIAVILFVPYVICELGSKVAKKEGIKRIFIIGALAFVGVLVFTENLSTAIIVFGIVAAMAYVVYPKSGQYVAVIVAIGVACYAALRVWGEQILTGFGGFRGRRVLVWLDPERYSGDGGYQIMQALYAIGSGGVFGKGLGNSAQKLKAIPEVQNDMILSAICEELGIFGVLIVMILFGMLLYRLLFIAQNAPDMYGSLIASGIFAHIALQVVFNIAVITNLIPTTGITLPFISYGGTSVLFLLAEMGIALNISRSIKMQE